MYFDTILAYYFDSYRYWVIVEDRSLSLQIMLHIETLKEIMKDMIHYDPFNCKSMPGIVSRYSMRLNMVQELIVAEQI